jgi:hypothetical protein
MIIGNKIERIKLSKNQKNEYFSCDKIEIKCGICNWENNSGAYKIGRTARDPDMMPKTNFFPQNCKPQKYEKIYHHATIGRDTPRSVPNIARSDMKNIYFLFLKISYCQNRKDSFSHFFHIAHPASRIFAPIKSKIDPTTIIMTWGKKRTIKPAITKNIQTGLI